MTPKELFVRKWRLMLTDSEVSILLLLRDETHGTLTSLANDIGMPITTVQSGLGSLLRDGLIIKEIIEKQKLYSLTESGHQILRQLLDK